METIDIAALLRKFSLFSELDQQQLATVAVDTQRLNVQRGDILFHRGDPTSGLYLLARGQIKLAVTSPQGTEKIIGLIGPGESFGEAIIFLNHPFYPIYAQATAESQVLLVSKRVIFDLLERDTSVARKMLAGLSMRNHQLVQDIESVSLLTSTQRLIGFLLQTATESLDGNRLTLPASKTNIASLLNLTPETLSRTMLKLQQAGLIEVRGKEIVILSVVGLKRFGLNGGG
jgi:CRP-like cAMP-binding protein